MRLAGRWEALAHVGLVGGREQTQYKPQTHPRSHLSMIGAWYQEVECRPVVTAGFVAADSIAQAALAK